MHKENSSSLNSRDLTIVDKSYGHDLRLKLSNMIYYRQYIEECKNTTKPVDPQAAAYFHDIDIASLDFVERTSDNSKIIFMLKAL